MLENWNFVMGNAEAGPRLSPFDLRLRRRTEFISDLSSLARHLLPQQLHTRCVWRLHEKDIDHRNRFRVTARVNAGLRGKRNSGRPAKRSEDLHEKSALDRTEESGARQDLERGAGTRKWKAHLLVRY